MSTDIASNSSSYSISFNLTSLFTLPTRLLARMRRIDDFINDDIQHAGSDSRFESTSYTRRNGSPSSITPFPGPWGFLTSGYAIGLFAMAVLLHRIQNVVVPPRRPPAYLVHRRAQISYTHLIYSSILPLDLSSLRTRFILHLPSLYFITKMLCIWTVILLQTSGLYPSVEWGWAQEVGNWVAGKSMETVCWNTFCAVCGAFCVEALTRGLEGTGTAANTSPFNLCGYAFLLHIYASPITHANKYEGMPSRPDKHVIVTIAIPLLQLTILHYLSVSQRLSRHRLIPTTLSSVLSLIHFHATLIMAPSSYPLLAYTPNLFESLLLLITLLTASLNALTQLLLEGAVTRPLFGHRDMLVPRWEEDFSVALLRVGTASLEATSLAGLGNEVGGVSLSDVRPESPVPTVYTEYGSLQMDRLGASSISPTIVVDGQRSQTRHGWHNEVRSVKASGKESEGLSDVWVDVGWYREFARFGVGIARFARGVVRMVWRLLRGKGWTDGRPRARAPRTPEPVGDDDDREDDRAREEDGGAETYARFLRGELGSDDDDGEEFDPHRAHRSPSPWSSDDENDGGDDDAETVGLYADLAGSVAGPPVLLAHMTAAEGSPITRRRYGMLVGGAGALPATDTPARGVRQRDTSSSDLSEARRNCVVCTAEPREIICWPCRCLALCDDCRENLASRSSASKHKCPCCRRSVEGYSRIFIP